MPYNPGSAYPRKTVYVPPTYGDTSFQRAMNAPDISTNPAAGAPMTQVFGREKFAASAGKAARSAQHAEAGVGFAEMSRTGGLGDQLANRYREQQGLKRQSKTQGNPAAQQKSDAAKDVSGQMADDVLTGDMPGDTGRANTRKSRKKKVDPNQGTLFDDY